MSGLLYRVLHHQRLALVHRTPLQFPKHAATASASVPVLVCYPHPPPPSPTLGMHTQICLHCRLPSEAPGPKQSLAPWVQARVRCSWKRSRQESRVDRHVMVRPLARAGRSPCMAYVVTPRPPRYFLHHVPMRQHVPSAKVVVATQKRGCTIRVILWNHKIFFLGNDWP